MARRGKAAPAPVSPTAQLLRHLDEQATVLRGHLDSLQQATAPESVHGVRVACRRLRAALWLLRPVLPQAREAGDRLRELARGLAELRETDVFMARLRAAAPELAQLAARLSTRREALAAAARDGARPTAALNALEALATGSVGFGTKVDALLPGRLRRLRRRFRRALKAAMKRATLKHAHALRLRAKKLRYALECLPATGKPAQRAVTALRKLQEALGESLDAASACKLLRAMRSAGPAERKLAATLRAEADRSRRELPGLIQRFERAGWPLLKVAVPKVKGSPT